MLSNEEIQQRDAERASGNAGLYRSLEEIASYQPKIEGVLTGLPYIDKLTAGLRPGKLNLCGAYSSHGKTALMLSIGVRVLLQGEPFLFFTADDSDDTVLAKVLAMYYEIGIEEVEMNGPKWRRKCARQLQDLLFICAPQQSSTYTADQVLWVYEEATQYWGKPPKFCGFDYLSLLALNFEGDDGLGNVKRKAQNMKQVARRTGDSVWMIGHQCKKDAGSDCPALTLNHLEFGGHQEADGVVIGCRRRLMTTKMPEWEMELEESTPTTNVSVMKNKITGRTSPNPVGTPYVIDSRSGLLREMTQDEQTARDRKGNGASAAGPLGRPHLVYPVRSNVE